MGEKRIHPMADLLPSLSAFLIFQAAAFLQANNTLHLHAATAEGGHVTHLGTNPRAATSYGPRKNLTQPGCRACFTPAPWDKTLIHRPPKSVGTDLPKCELRQQQLERLRRCHQDAKPECLSR